MVYFGSKWKQLACHLCDVVYFNQLCLMRVAHNSIPTDKPVALEFQIKLEFRSVVFLGGKPENPKEKSLEQG